MKLRDLSVRAIMTALIFSIAACREEGSGGSESVAVDPPPAALLAGDAFYQSQDYDSAEARFRSARDLARQSGDPAVEAAATLGLGRVAYRRDDDYPAARALALQALGLQQKHRLDHQMFESYTLLGLIAYDEGRYFESVELQTTARDLALAAADTANLLKAWTNLALPQIELGNFPAARANLMQSLAVAPNHGNPLREGRILINLAMQAIKAGNPAEGLDYAERGRVRAREAGDRDGELNLLGHLAIAYAQMGEPGRAIAYLDTARTEARARDAVHEEASSLEQMAGVFLDAGEYPRALRLYHEANDLNTRLGLTDEVAANQRSIGEIYFSLDNLELARRSVSEALMTHRRIGARLNTLGDLLLLARIAQEQRDPARAAILLSQASALADTLGTAAARLDAALARARLADLRNDSRAVLAALRSVAMSPAASGTDREWETHWLAARAHARTSALAQAAESGQRAVDGVERIRGGFGSGALRTAFLTEREEVYRDQVDVLLRLGRVAAAFETADRARGRVLVEHLATLHPNGGASVRELAEGERALLRQIDSVSEAIARARAAEARSDPPARGELDRLHTELDRIRSAYGDALTQAQERAADRVAIAGGARPDVGRIGRALRPDEALLEFLVEPERVLLFVLRGERIASFVVPTRRDALSTRIRVVRELTGRASRPDAPSAALEALHDALLGEARRSGILAGASTLIVVPHAELTYVPFAALRNPATGRYLVEDFALLHLPSAAALPVLRERPVHPGRHAVAFSPFIRDLPGTAAEAKALARSLGGQVRRGRQASESRVRSALGEAGLVHLATHGVLNLLNPLFSRVELSHPGTVGGPEDDGRLEVHEVNRLAIKAALVFLSGCETGLGAAGSTRFSTGEDYATLERAFLQAGAANVAATLWRIEDEGAAALVERFYAELASSLQRDVKGGGRLADVLSRAQRELIKDPKYGAPYYWAGFRLSGSGEYPDPSGGVVASERQITAAGRSGSRPQGTAGWSVPDRHAPPPGGAARLWG